jgi:hypothetical protein
MAELHNLDDMLKEGQINLTQIKKAATITDDQDQNILDELAQLLPEERIEGWTDRTAKFQAKVMSWTGVGVGILALLGVITLAIWYYRRFKYTPPTNRASFELAVLQRRRLGQLPKSPTAPAEETNLFN